LLNLKNIKKDVNNANMTGIMFENHNDLQDLKSAKELTQ